MAEPSLQKEWLIKTKLQKPKQKKISGYELIKGLEMRTYQLTESQTK